MRNKREILYNGLGDDETVERVLMEERKTGQIFVMQEGRLKEFNVIFN